jgi:hypothetical protein
VASANPDQGEIEIVVNGETFTLKMSMRAARIVEKKTGKTLGQLIKLGGDIDANAINTLAWLLLQKHHGERFKTEDQVSDWIDDAGGILAFFRILADLVKANQEKVETGEATGGAMDSPLEAQTH